MKDCAFIATGRRNTRDAETDGIYPFFVRSQVPLSASSFDYFEEAVITAGDGVGVGKVFHHVDGPYALHQRAYRVVPDLKILNSRFLYHYFVYAFRSYLEKTAHHSSVTSLRKPMFERFVVPLPALCDQERITDILDQMDALVNDLSSGLPAEIAARRKQYEHYRDRLLSFPELKKDEPTGSTEGALPDE